MLAGESIISILFECINFGVLFVLFGYLFKRYGWQTIKSQIASQEAVVQSLKQEKEQLRIDQKNLDRRYEEQQALALDLEQKIMRWREAVQIQQNNYKQYQNQCALAVIKKVEIQNKHVELEALQRQVLPHVIAQSAAELKKQFVSDAQGKSYLEQLITYMERAQA